MQSRNRVLILHTFLNSLSSMKCLNINGIGTKVITLSAIQGKLQYRLSTQQRIGLPDGSKVLGFGLRLNEVANLTNEKSINNRPLITFEMASGMSLNLKGFGQTSFLSDINLFQFCEFFNPDDGFTLQPYMNFIKPILAELISWNKSYIGVSYEIATNLIGGKSDIELIVYYTVPESLELPPPTSGFINGVDLYAYKQTSVYINLESGRTYFPLTKDGKSGIDDNDVIFGVRAPDFKYYTSNNYPQPLPPVYGSAFFTFKCGRQIVLDNQPFRMLFSPRLLQLPYFPLQPAKAGAYDWQGSNVYISDTTLLTNDTAFMLTFYHYSPDEKCN